MRSLVLSLWIVLSAGTYASSADAILGYWVMQDGSALIEVYAQADGYAVRITALKEERFTVADVNGKVGEPRRDIHNPDPGLRQRPLVGLIIASGLNYREGRWQGGRIYDPGTGNSYRCQLELSQGGFLRVRGYVGIALLGRTLYWQRADDFQRKVGAMLSALKPEILVE